MTKKPGEVLSKLQEFHLDALQEIGNIGAGHSATALSQLLNRRVDMSVPRVVLCAIEEFSTKVLTDPEEPLVAVLSETSGDVQMQIIGFLDHESIRRLLWIMRKQKFEEELLELSSIDRSFVREIGNILLLHYIAAINEFTDLFMYPQVPSLAIDMGKAILDNVIALKGPDYSNILSIEVDIFTDNVQLKSTIAMLPEQTSLDRLMIQLFSEGWAQG